MEKRKFNKHRLYLLIRTVVILATLSLLIHQSLLYYKMVPYLENQFNKDATNCNNNYSKSVKELTKPAWLSETEWQQAHNNALASAEKEREDCINGLPAIDLQTASSDRNLSTTEFNIAILLPLIFIGGRLVYKYIFPINKD